MSTSCENLVRIGLGMLGIYLTIPNFSSLWGPKPHILNHIALGTEHLYFKNSLSGLIAFSNRIFCMVVQQADKISNDIARHAIPLQ